MKIIDTHDNLANAIFYWAEKDPSMLALIANDREITYGELAKAIKSVAAELASPPFSIGLGDRIGILLYNEPAYVIAYFAILALGATVIPVNVRLTAHEVETILTDAGAKALVTSASFEEILKDLGEVPLNGVLFQGESQSVKAAWPVVCVDTVLKASKVPPLDLPLMVDSNTLATLVYTSGTTGKPKGVSLTHKNIAADALANIQVIEATHTDRFVTISPLFHVFGQTNVLVTAMIVGASVVLIPKFSPRLALESVSKYGVTFMAAVPTMYQMMLTHLKDHHYDLDSVRVCHSGAAAMPVHLITAIEETFDAPVQEGYGLSEATSIVCSNPLQGPRKPGSVGPAIPTVSLKVVDPEGNELPAGQTGELCVKGPTVMLGYWQKPDETAKVFCDGWLKTKDMAYLDDDGYAYIVDRQDDLINVGGVKVYPREIEEVLYRHPAIESVAVIGEPSFLYHQEIKAYVVLRSDNTLSLDELHQHCAPWLATYKIPKRLAIVDHIPTGATGKILRNRLRHIAKE